MGTLKLTVVVDAGPLIHLAEIDGLSLFTIFESLQVPEAVWLETVGKGRVAGTELSRLGNLQRSVLAEQEVRLFIQQHQLNDLHAGEIECLYLCHALHIPTFLTDDLAARKAAKQLHITPVGSLGIVVNAYQRGTISLTQAENYLNELGGVSSLFVTKAIVELAIEQLHYCVK